MVADGFAGVRNVCAVDRLAGAAGELVVADVVEVDQLPGGSVHPAHDSKPRAEPHGPVHLRVGGEVADGDLDRAMLVGLEQIGHLCGIRRSQPAGGVDDLLHRHQRGRSPLGALMQHVADELPAVVAADRVGGLLRSRDAGAPTFCQDTAGR